MVGNTMEWNETMLVVEGGTFAVVMGGGGAGQVAVAARINFCAIDSRSESPKIFPSTRDDGEIVLVSATPWEWVNLQTDFVFS
jgi:hypothetical protein